MLLSGHAAGLLSHGFTSFYKSAQNASESFLVVVHQEIAQLGRNDCGVSSQAYATCRAVILLDIYYYTKNRKLGLGTMHKFLSLLLCIIAVHN